MRALLINPWTRKVLSVDHPTWDLDSMYAQLSGPELRKCDDINTVRLGRNQILWVDGEGFLIPNVRVWRLRGYDSPLAGLGLVLALNEAGDSIATYLEPEWMESMIEWTDLVTTGELGPMTEGPGFVQFGAPILKEMK